MTPLEAINYLHQNVNDDLHETSSEEERMTAEATHILLEMVARSAGLPMPAGTLRVRPSSDEDVITTFLNERVTRDAPTLSDLCRHVVAAIRHYEHNSDDPNGDSGVELAIDELERHMAQHPDVRRRVFNQVLSVNVERCLDWHKDGEPWLIVDWSNAVAGEAGELSNKVKKIRRIDTGMKAQRPGEDHRWNLIEEVAKEVADVFLYLQLLLHHLTPAEAIGFNMYDVIAEKFNKTSIEFGFEQRMVL